MNKKFFAALASATMALSATGSLAVFADEFDTVDEVTNIVDGSVNTNPDGSVAFTKANFPDADFRDAIITAYGKLGITVSLDQVLTKDELAKIKAINVNDAKDAANSCKSVAGIEVFPNLETFTSNSQVLTSADLSANTKLNTVEITDAISLTELKLPATNALKKIVLKGDNSGTRCPLPILDLSGNKGLNEVTINGTDVANIDLSNNTFLEKLDVRNNKINTLNVDGALNLKTLNAAKNNLYSVELPAYSKLETVNLYKNKLQSLDVTKELNLKSLDVADNCLKTLDLSENTKLEKLNVVDNNLGYLDLSNTALTVDYDLDVNSRCADTTFPSGAAAVSTQHAFVDAEYDTVDLAANFEGLDKDKLHGAKNATLTGSTFKFNKEGDNYKGVGSYVYNTGKGFMRTVVAKADLMNRLYNPNSGEHFYTKDANEKNVLVGLGWQDEGIGWVAPNKDQKIEYNPAAKISPVYRLYNPNAGDHHYTKDSRERDALVSAGWKSEGIGWYTPDTNFVYDSADTGNKFKMTVTRLDLFREYNPNAKAAGSHNYTLNEAENDFLCSIGWIPEGIAWSSLK